MEKVIALLPWDITVRRARSRRHVHELIDRKDADQAIRALSEVETFYVVKELGLESAVPILASIEPRQMRALIDLDVWHEHRADLSDLLLWLAAFREVDLEQLACAVRAIDPELFALLLRRRLFIVLRPKEEDAEFEDGSPVPEWLRDPPPEIMPLVETPDRRFIIAARATDEVADEDGEGYPIDEEDRKLVLELVDLLYRDPDMDLIAGALRLAESDLSSDLEESAYRFRSGRLEDLGFPELSRVMEVYAPLDPDEVLKTKEPNPPLSEVLLPELHASRLSSGLFLEILRSMDSPEIIRRVEGELLPLANAVLVADRVEPGDLERLRQVLDRIRAYLELALSHGVDAGRLIDVGRERLAEHSVRTLFRVGYAITLELGHRARRLKARGAFRAGGDDLNLLSEVDRAVVESSAERRPVFPRVLEDATRPIDETRPFLASQDVERVRALLADLENLASAVEALELRTRNERLSGALDPPLAHERNVDMLLTTAAAQALLGRGFVLEPLEAADLGRLRAMLEASNGPTGERGFPSDRVERASALAFERTASTPGIALAVGRRVREGLGALSEALSPLVGESEIDPRYVGVVVRRVD